MNAFFSDHAIESNIPVRGFNLVDLLKPVGNTNQEGTLPSAEGTRIAECPVVIATTHTDTVERGIKRNKRHDNDIKPADRWRQCTGCTTRFPDAIPVPDERALAIPVTEKQSPVPERMQDRQIEAFVFTKQVFDERCGIEFAVDRKIGRDMFCLADDRV